MSPFPSRVVACDRALVLDMAKHEHAAETKNGIRRKYSDQIGACYSSSVRYPCLATGKETPAGS